MSSRETQTPDTTEASASVTTATIYQGRGQRLLDAQLLSPPINNTIVTIHCREKALSTSEAAAQLQPHLPPYELSLWTDASFPGPRRVKSRDVPQTPSGLVGLGVVHRRWDMSSFQPGDRYWGTTWWLSGYVAPNITSSWQAEALGVVQALRMAFWHCKQISRALFTARREQCRATTISGPMPTLINIFSDNIKVLESFGGLSDPNLFPRDKWLNRIATGLIERLGKYNVRVNFQWVPGHSKDKWNAWAHEGARIATKRGSYSRKVYNKETHRVMVVPRRDRYSPQTTSVTLIGDGVATQKTTRSVEE